MQHPKQFWRSLFFILLITALCGGMALPAVSLPARAAPEMQMATNIVISEFRSRGPNGGNDEFVELYNPTANPIDITGWKLNSWSPSSGMTATRATLPSFILQPGQHYLLANSNAGGRGSITPDLTYGTGFAD